MPNPAYWEVSLPIKANKILRICFRQSYRTKEEKPGKFRIFNKKFSGVAILGVCQKKQLVKQPAEDGQAKTQQRTDQDVFGEFPVF